MIGKMGKSTNLELQGASSSEDAHPMDEFFTEMVRPVNSLSGARCSPMCPFRHGSWVTPFPSLHRSWFIWVTRSCDLTILPRKPRHDVQIIEVCFRYSLAHRRLRMKREDTKSQKAPRPTCFLRGVSCFHSTTCTSNGYPTLPSSKGKWMETSIPKAAENTKCLVISDSLDVGFPKSRMNSKSMHISVAPWPQLAHGAPA